MLCRVVHGATSVDDNHGNRLQDMEDLLDARVGVAVAVDVERGGRLIRTSIQVCLRRQTLACLGCRPEEAGQVTRLEQSR